MDVFNTILIWVHFIGLMMGGAATFGIPAVAAQMATAGPDNAPALARAMKLISSISRAGLGALLVIGPLLVWLKYGGFGGFTWWFWVKMALVVLLVGAVIYAGINAKAAFAGDAEAARRGPVIGRISMILTLAVVLSAVFAFD